MMGIEIFFFNENKIQIGRKKTEIMRIRSKYLKEKIIWE